MRLAGDCDTQHHEAEDVLRGGGAQRHVEGGGLQCDQGRSSALPPTPTLQPSADASFVRHSACLARTRAGALLSPPHVCLRVASQVVMAGLVDTPLLREVCNYVCNLLPTPVRVLGSLA